MPRLTIGLQRRIGRKHHFRINEPAFAGVVPDGAVPSVFQPCPVDVRGRGYSGAAKAPLADFDRAMEKVQ